MTPGDLCNFVVARQYSIVKELDYLQSSVRVVFAAPADAWGFGLVVGGPG